MVLCGGALVLWWCCGHGSAVVFCGITVVVVEKAIAVVAEEALTRRQGERCTAMQVVGFRFCTCTFSVYLEKLINKNTVILVYLGVSVPPAMTH